MERWWKDRRPSQKHQKEFAANKVRQLPPFESLKVAAFIKVLSRFPSGGRGKLIELVHNRIAGNLQIDPSVNIENIAGAGS